jgi:hypothetical protein
METVAPDGKVMANPTDPMAELLVGSESRWEQLTAKAPTLSVMAARRIDFLAAVRIITVSS